MMAQQKNSSSIGENEAVEFETAVSLTGFGLYNMMLLLLCGSILMSVIMETMCMSYILPAAQCDLSLTLYEKSILSSVGFLAVVISSLMWGFIGDTIGRRNIILNTAFISFFFGVASSFSPYSWVLIVLRFLNGFFIGGPSAVIIAYLGEFHGNKYRPRVITWTGTFVAFASFLLPGFAWLILPLNWDFSVPGIGPIEPWRLLVILYSLPTFISTVFLIRFPESPKYLWASGKPNEAIQILRRMYAVNTRNSEDSYPVKKLIFSLETTTLLNKTTSSMSVNKKICSLFRLLWKQLTPLFHSPLLSKTVLSALLQFGLFVTSAGYAMWFPEILIRVSSFVDHNPDKSFTVCDAINYKKNVTDPLLVPDVTSCTNVINEDVFKITLITGAFFAITYMLIGFVINVTGKKPLLVALLLITGLVAIAINFVQSYLLIALLSGAFLMVGAGVSITNTVVVDLFPTNYRAMAVAICLMAGRMGGMVSSNVIGYQLDYSCQSLYYAFSGEHFVLIIIALILPTSSNVPKVTAA